MAGGHGGGHDDHGKKGGGGSKLGWVGYVMTGGLVFSLLMCCGGGYGAWSFVSGFNTTTVVATPSVDDVDMGLVPVATETWPGPDYLEDSR